MIDGIDWLIDGIRVDFVTMNQPERTRGESVSLDCVIEGRDAEGSGPGIGFIMGGPDGATMGGPDGASMTIDEKTEGPPRKRYELLRAYGEYAGEGTSYQLIGGLPAVHENPQDEWPVESHIVPIEPSYKVYATPGFWALITGYSDESQTFDLGSALFELELELTFLGDLDEFDDRDDLLEELSPVTVQYPNDID